MYGLADPFHTQFVESDRPQIYSWIPVDKAARAILEILFQGNPPHLVYHVENPIHQPWQGLIMVLLQRLGLQSTPVPFNIWPGRALGSVNSITSLYKFFCQEFMNLSSGGLILDTKHTQKFSHTFRICSGVSLDLLDMHIEQWKKKKKKKGFQ